MAAFAYRALDGLGHAQRGLVEARNVVDARRMLCARQLVPLAVKTEGVGTALSKGVWRRRIGAKALAMLTRQLATLIATDIRLEEALRLVAAQALSPPPQAHLR